MPYAPPDEVTEVSPRPDVVRVARREEKAARYGARHGTLIGLAIATGLCVIAAFLFVVLRVPTGPGDSTRCRYDYAGLVDVKASCTEPVILEERGDQVVVYPGASLERLRDSLRVRRGKASFIAHKRTDGSTLRVHVSHGVIEVTGTRFTVEQGESGGRVELTEGTIVFHDDDGDDVTLSAGAVLVWPLEHDDVAAQRPASQPPLTAVPPPKRQTAPSRKQATSRTTKPTRAPLAAAEEADEGGEAEEEVEPPRTTLTMEEILQRIASLRQQKRLRAAVDLLVSQSQRGDITPAQMARLSWEVGLFIQETSDKAAACTHWRNHARKYPDDSVHIERVRNLVEACDTAL